MQHERFFIGLFGLDDYFFTLNYLVDQMKHKHYKLIVAWAEGLIIERKDEFNDWEEIENPVWNLDTEYRVKPQEETT